MSGGRGGSERGREGEEREGGRQGVWTCYCALNFDLHLKLYGRSN